MVQTSGQRGEESPTPATTLAALLIVTYAYARYSNCAASRTRAETASLYHQAVSTTGPYFFAQLSRTAKELQQKRV